MSIEVREVSRSFGAFQTLDRVSLHVPEGALVALLGPSGSGKTTLLRIIAGLERADSGQVLLEGKDAARTSVKDRGVGFVFQHYALFRQMTVRENVAFGLRVRPRRARPTETEIRERVASLLRLVQLDWLADRYPAQLSGGQRQRVALARALAVEPRLLLLDEPFGALDARVRQELRRWLRRLHDEIRLTSVFVTHDQEEALELADRVVLMNRGKVEQEGSPEELFEHPKTPFVMGFLGNVNVFHGRVENGKALLGPLAVDYPEHPHGEALPAAGYARPHELAVSRTPDSRLGMWAVLRDVSATGPVVRLELHDAEARAVEVHLARSQFDALRPSVGERLFVTARRVRVFLDPGGELAGSGI